MRSEGLLAGESALLPSSWLTDKRSDIQTLILAILPTFSNISLSFAGSARLLHSHATQQVDEDNGADVLQSIHVTTQTAMGFDIIFRHGTHIMRLSCSATADCTAPIRSRAVISEQ